MTDKSLPANTTDLQTLQTTRDLSREQRALVDVMRSFEFGRVENMKIQNGHPILDQSVRIVRVARLGGKSGGNNVPRADEFELNRAIWHLFEELTRLGNGLVVSLEFKRGLPCLLETSGLQARTSHRKPGTED